MSDNGQPTSTKPYLVRAIYEWCTDNGYTPYVAVFVNAAVRVPMEYVKNREIVLNVSFEATQGLKIDNDAITFRARFAGVARDIAVPTDNIVAVYARENGQGMAFPLTPELQREQEQGSTSNLSGIGIGGEQKHEADDDKTVSPAPARKPKLASVETATDEQNKNSKSSTGNRRKNIKSTIHAVGPQDTQQNNGKANDPRNDEPPHDPSDNPPGGNRPTLKRVK